MRVRAAVVLSVCLAVVLGIGPVAAASQKSGELQLLDYSQASFSPSRSEVFRLHLKTTAIRKLQLTIYSSDGDVIRRYPVQAVDAAQSQQLLEWDGRDDAGELVPDEAYVPVIVGTDLQGADVRIDTRQSSGGEEVYEFTKRVQSGVLEYELPFTSRLLIRAGIKNGPMLASIVDWQPRSAGFHAERWSGYDMDGVINIEQQANLGYLLIGYRLPQYSILTEGNTLESYRAYRERKAWVSKPVPVGERLLERQGIRIRPEFYAPVLAQKSPHISVRLESPESGQPQTRIGALAEVMVRVDIDPSDELYLDQERYEISFFVDHQFIAEEEQGFVPFSWRWSPGRLGTAPGAHVLTVNVSGYGGQVGVKHLAFELEVPSQP